MAKSRLKWVASVCGEGGPLMIADLPDFAQWTGVAPYGDLGIHDRARTLHYWGQFTDRLPPPFRADGGHQYLQCASEAEAKAKLGELVRAVKKALPKVTVTEEPDQTTFVLPGGDEDQEMWAELSPKSEYDASWQAHEEAEWWVHGFGKSAKGLFWELEGDGVAEIGVTQARDELVLVRSWIDEDAHEKQVRAAVDAPDPREEKVAEFTIASGKAVVIWSPIAAFMLEGIDGAGALAALGETDKADMLESAEMEDVGAVVRLKPGRWAVSIAKTEDDDDDDDDEDDDDDDSSWSARWCRLKWLGP